MSNAPALQVSDPPDLLRRFVPVLHELCVIDGSLHLHLTTNEPRLAAALGGFSGLCACDRASIKCTIVCDPDLPPELSEGMEIDTPDAVILSFGQACVMAINRAGREIRGFVAHGIVENAWPLIVAPALKAATLENP